MWILPSSTERGPQGGQSGHFLYLRTGPSSQECARLIWTQGLLSLLSFFLSSSFFLMATPMAYEVPRLGVESELQLPAYATAMATLNPGCICDLPAACSNARSLTAEQGQGLNPHPHGDNSLVLNPLNCTGKSHISFLNFTSRRCSCEFLTFSSG